MPVRSQHNIEGSDLMPRDVTVLGVTLGNNKIKTTGGGGIECDLIRYGRVEDLGDI
jgi:hypothetical protein